MAFYRDTDDEDELESNEGGGVATSPESGLISAQGDSGQGAQNQTAAQNTAAPDKSGFVGFNHYLNANKKQAEKLGDQTAGVIQSSADQARQGVAGLNQAADEAIKPTQSLGQSILGKIQNNAETLSDAEKNQVKQTSAAQYTGPKSVVDLGDAYSNAQKATKTATQNIDNANTEAGRTNLVTQVNSKPRTLGMNQLDTSLLQTGGGYEKINQAAKANQDVKGALNSATEQIQGKIGRADDPTTPDIDESSGAIGQTNKSREEALKSVTDALNAWKSGFAPKVSQAQQSLIDQQKRVLGDIGDNPYGLDQETMDLLGLSAGQRVYDLDLNSYVNQANAGDINAGNVASALDYARYGALADLAGETDLLLDPTNASNAGKAPALTANTSKLAADMKAKDEAYNASYVNDRGVLANAGSMNPGSPNEWSFNSPAWAADYIASLSPKERALQGVPLETNLKNATANEIEKFWIPLFMNPPAQATRPQDWPARAQELQRQIQEWQKRNHYTNVINPGQAPVPGVGK